MKYTDLPTPAQKLGGYPRRTGDDAETIKRYNEDVKRYNALCRIHKAYCTAGKGARRAQMSAIDGFDYDAHPGCERNGMFIILLGLPVEETYPILVKPNRKPAVWIHTEFIYSIIEPSEQPTNINEIY